MKRMQSRTWMPYPGRVEFTNVETRQIYYVPYYVARLDYSYSVNGDYYSGYKEKVFILNRTAQEFSVNLKEKMVFVRADPEKPERSALLEHDQPGGWPN